MGEDALGRFISEKRADAGPVVVALDAAIRGTAALDVDIKWRQLVYALGGDFHHWICAIAVNKTRVTLNFHFGALLPDAERVFRAGTSTFMRMLDFESADDVDAALVAEWVNDALGQLEFFKVNGKRIQQES